MHDTKPTAQFVRVSKSLWREAIDELFTRVTPNRHSWDDIGSIRRVLNHIAVEKRCGQGGRINAACKWLPFGGTSEHGGTEAGNEDGAFYLKTHQLNRQADFALVKPVHLNFNLPIAHSGEAAYDWAYFWLELSNLQLSGVYDAETGETYRKTGYEPVCEIEPGNYADIGIWEQGFMGYNEGGFERPLPKSARPVKRILGGSIVFFCKGSDYNLKLNREPDGLPPEEGLHEQMGEEHFARFIRDSVQQST